MARVFVSYTRSDTSRVWPLVSLLEAEGCNVWWDRDIRPGRQFEQEIERALEDADWVLVALTENASQSDWVRAESAAAQDQSKLIPVLLDDVAVPLSLSTLQVADLRRWPEDIASAKPLIDAIAATPGGTMKPEKSFVGRERAISTLRESFGDTLERRGQLVMVSGEPGIGKTHCVEEFTRISEDLGALVLWGRCHDQMGAPPYWPWVQILREFAEANSDDELRVALSDHNSQIGALLPEVYNRLGIAEDTPDSHDSVEDTFRLFDAVARLLAKHAHSVPLVLIIDDLHWADRSSLSMLEFLVRELSRESILIVCTYRDVEVTRKSPIVSTLAELNRAGRSKRLRLTGLTRNQTAQLIGSIASISLPGTVVDSIYDQTDGNPLFVCEVARVIAEEHASTSGSLLTIDVPDGVHEAIGRRLDRLSERCNEFLVIGSVIGREFELAVLADVAATDLASCLAELDTAARAGILQDRTGNAVSYRFKHAVIRETIYAELSTLERLTIHDKIVESLKKIHGRTLAPVLSQLVHHCVEASALGAYERTVEYALLAAKQDERVFAYEEAVRHNGIAIRYLAENECSDDPRITNAYFRNGHIQRSLGNIDQAITDLTCGIASARQQADTEMFRRCVLALVFVSSHLSQDSTAPLLREALGQLPEHDVANRAIVLAHLAFALRSLGDYDEVVALGKQAISLARESNDDAVLASTLRFSVMALRGQADSLHRRIGLGAEMVELSNAIAEPEEIADCWYLHLLNLLELGDIVGFERLLARYARHVAPHRLGRHSYQSSLLSVSLQLLRGEWESAQAGIEAALAEGQKLNRQEAESVYGAQMFLLNRDRGQLQGLEPVIRQLLVEKNSRLWAPGLMLMCAEASLLDDARVGFEKLAGNDFRDVATDEMWITCILFCSITSIYLEDTARGKVLYGLLLPYQGQTANHPAAACYGAIDAYIGMLAQLQGDDVAARQHLENGAAKNRAMGAWPALVRTELSLARLLLSSSDSGDVETGRKLLPELEQLAARFRLSQLSTEISALLSDYDAELPDSLTPREVDVLKLLAIGRSNKDISKVLAISLSTVATHIRSILVKTHCANRTEAAAYAMQQGLTDH